MKQKELFKLLDGIQEQGEETVQSERILFIDGLNLFFRNFEMSLFFVADNNFVRFVDLLIVAG